MSRVCDLTGTKPFYGNKVSHSNIKTRTRWLPNLQTKRYVIPELKLVVTLYLSARAIRTIDKMGGISKAIFNAKEKDLSSQLLRVRNRMSRPRRAQGRADKAKAAKSK